MTILYIGDITGRPGRTLTAELLPKIKEEFGVDYVIAQGENMAHGKGLRPVDIEQLSAVGVDFFTGGNHTLARADIHPMLEDAQAPVIRPANLRNAPGKGWSLQQTPHGAILIVSLQGQIVGDRQEEIDNPLLTIDAILDEHKNTKRAATVVNFHGDFSSEKVVIGQYLDGSVSAVIGDHWHVPTADAQVQPKGTAHISDVGMVGALDASLGVKTEVIVQRWKHEHRSRNEMETGGRLQFNAVVVDVDTATGLARSIKQVRRVLEP